MRITDAIPVIEAHLDADIPVMLWGAPGIGKSDIVRQIAQKRGWYCIDRFRLSQMDPTDLKGVPSVVNGRTQWNPPADLPDEARDGLNGIVFLDEIVQGDRQTMAAAMQFVLDGTIGSYTKPKGCRVMGAGNRVSDKSGANKMLAALANRFAHVDIDVDFESWKLWAIASGILPEIVAFLAWSEARGNSLLHKMPDADARAFPSPRSWEKTSRAIALAPKMAFQIAAANVGEPAAVELKGFLDVYRDIPKIPDIIASPTTTRVPLEPSAQYAVSSALARAADASNLASIVTYLNRFPVEFSVMAISDAVRRDVSLKQAPGFSDWAIRNQHVLS